MAGLSITAMALIIAGSLLALAGGLLAAVGAQRARRGARAAIPHPGPGASAEEESAYIWARRRSADVGAPARYAVPGFALLALGALSAGIAFAALFGAGWASALVDVLPDLGRTPTSELPSAPAEPVSDMALALRIAVLGSIAVTLVIFTGVTLVRVQSRALSLPRWPRRRVEHPPYPEFAFTLPAGEAPSRPWHKPRRRGGTRYVQTRHLRQVGPEGLNPAGGTSGQTLCGRAMNGGSSTVPEEDFTLRVSFDDTAVPDPCYQCEQRHGEVVEAFEYEVGILPLSARDQRQWDAYRRKHAPWLVEDRYRR